MSGAVIALLGRSADASPDAVNWANISGASPSSNAAQTFTGITTTVTLRVAIADDPITLEYSLNSGAWTSITSDVTDINVVLNDTLAFRASGLPSSTNSTVTVKNHTLGGTTLDTFTVVLT